MDTKDIVAIIIVALVAIGLIALLVIKNRRDRKNLMLPESEDPVEEEIGELERKREKL